MLRRRLGLIATSSNSYNSRNEDCKPRLMTWQALSISPKAEAEFEAERKKTGTGTGRRMMWQGLTLVHFSAQPAPFRH
jgi:hypothetical protein